MRGGQRHGPGAIIDERGGQRRRLRAIIDENTPDPTDAPMIVAHPPPGAPTEIGDGSDANASSGLASATTEKEGDQAGRARSQKCRAVVGLTPGGSYLAREWGKVVFKPDAICHTSVSQGGKCYVFMWV